MKAALLLLLPTPLLAILALPMLISGGGAEYVGGCSRPAGPLTVILQTIRLLESSDNYTVESSGSTASGAYQFVDGTWRSWAAKAGVDTNQYPRAKDAPPDAQDQVAGAHVQDILDNHDGQVEAVPVVWYLGHLPEPDSDEWDTVPNAGANVLTPREYQTKWMTQYNALLETHVTDTDQPDDTLKRPRFFAALIRVAALG